MALSTKQLHAVAKRSQRLTTKLSALATPYGIPGAIGPGGMAGATGPAGPINQNVGAPQQGTRGKPSDQRFRSFAERYAIARAHNFSTDPKQLPEDQWECIMDAKRMYNMIKETGRTIGPETGEDTF